MIDFDRYASLVINFFSGNLFVTIGVVVVLVYFIYKKPSETIKFLGVLVLLIAVLYVMSLLTESGSHGVSNKNEMTEKTLKEITGE